MDQYQVASWVCCVCAVVGFAVYSVVFALFEWRKEAASGAAVAKKTTEDFVTARKTANLSQVSWSFYATSVGAWVIVTPANYAVFAGWIGMTMYALSCGIPCVAIAFMGEPLTPKSPQRSRIGTPSSPAYGSRLNPSAIFGVK